METRANYVMVGGFVLAFSVGLVFFVLWLAKFQHDVEFIRYDIIFQGSVTGLSDGAAVRYNGVKVGEVVFIGLDRENPSRVRALVEVESNTPVRVDTEASLAFQGLTGKRYVLLSGGSLDSDKLTQKADEKRPVIPSKPSPIDQVMQGAPEAIASANALLIQANEIVGPENRERINEILDNTATLTRTLAEKSDRIGATMDDLAATMANLRETTGALQTMAEGLREDSERLTASAEDALSAVETMAGSIDDSVNEASDEVTGLIKDMRVTAKSFSTMAKEFQAIASENRKPIRDFTTSGLYELNTLLIEARSLLAGLNRMTTEVERDPARFLFGNQQQGYETQQ